MAIIEALLIEKNVSRAAIRLGLSQPAFSHALARLRKRLNDSLFVQTSAGMRPTPLVEQMAAPILRAIKIVREEICELQSFDPLHSQRRFKIHTKETGALILIPRILEALAQKSPGTRIELVEIQSDSLWTSLDEGAIDIALGYIPNLQPRFVQQKLFDSGFTAIVRKEHPQIGKRITINQLADSQYITTPIVESILFEFDTELRQRRIERKIAFTTSHVISIPKIVESTNWIALIPDDLLETCLRLAKVRQAMLPVKVRRLPITQAWHSRFHADPGHRFLRETIYHLFARPDADL